LHDAADRIGELSSQNATLAAQKRKLEGDAVSIQADLDEAIVELKNSEERLKKASSDAARLAEELRHEQVRSNLLNYYIIIKFKLLKEHAIQVDRLRKGLEQQIKDLQVRLDEAELNAIKGGKRIIQKLEQRVKSLKIK
jgi:myosin heavy chain 6/7